jgi:uncharacterized membrane protein
MLTEINICHVDLHRHVPRIEPALAQRLETLTGEDASCCVADFKADIVALRAAPIFSAALARHKALADEKRLTALALLKRHGTMCACEVQAALGLTHGTVSHHMALLHEAGLIESEKRGKWVHYSLTPAGRREAVSP